MLIVLRVATFNLHSGNKLKMNVRKLTEAALGRQQ